MKESVRQPFGSALQTKYACLVHRDGSKIFNKLGQAPLVSAVIPSDHCTAVKINPCLRHSQKRDDVAPKVFKSRVAGGAEHYWRRCGRDASQRCIRMSTVGQSITLGGHRDPLKGLTEPPRVIP